MNKKNKPEIFSTRANEIKKLEKQKKTEKAETYIITGILKYLFVFNCQVLHGKLHLSLYSIYIIYYKLYTNIKRRDVRGQLI